MKKKIELILMSVVLIIGMTITTGCEAPETTVVNEGAKIQRYSIPDNGIVTKDVFEALQGTANTDVYSGSVDQVGYVWTFNGADIDNPMDFNLNITLTDTADQDVQSATNSAKVTGFSYTANEGVPGKYNLRLNLPEKWDCESIDLYNLSGDSLNKVGTVKMDNSGDVTKVNFGLTVASGTFYLVSSTQMENSDDVLGEDTYELTQEEIDQLDAEGKALKQEAITNDQNYSGATDEYGTQLGNIPDGQPGPTEPGATIDYTSPKKCTLSVSCANIWDSNYYGLLNKEKEAYQPKDGWIFKEQSVTYYPGESVFDVLERNMKDNNIQLEFSTTPIYNSNYIEGINNLYEFDCGELSGWMYCVNGWYPNYGISRYGVKEGDVIQINYTCDLGRDLASDNWMAQ